MSLKESDLVDVVLPKISIDEFEPKTGEKENVAVMGFFVTEQSVGEDLANFINKGSTEYRDVEVSPNPTENNEYMVFVEFDRNEQVLQHLSELVNDISHLCGDLDWKVKPLVSEESVPLDLSILSTLVATSPENYVTKEQHEDNLQKNKTQSIENFLLDNMNATQVSLEDNIVSLKDYKYNIKLEFVNFGEGKLTLEESGLSELAIDSDFDYTLIKTLESMRGSLNVIPINKHIVLHHPSTDKVLIAKPC
jgi:predicted RNA-binding protein with RPS1 domain